MKKFLTASLVLAVLVGISGVFETNTLAKMRKVTINISNESDFDIPLLEIAFDDEQNNKKNRVRHQLGGLKAGESSDFDVNKEGVAEIIAGNDGKCGGPKVQIYDGSKITITNEMICKDF